MSLLQSGVDRLSQIPEKAKMFFQETAVPENEEAEAVLKSPEAGTIGSAFLAKTSGLSSWNAEAFLAVMKEIQKETGVKGKNLWMPIRVMLTGQEHGPELPKIVEIFGLEKCRRLVQAYRSLLGRNACVTRLKRAQTFPCDRAMVHVTCTFATRILRRTGQQCENPLFKTQSFLFAFGTRDAEYSSCYSSRRAWPSGGCPPANPPFVPRPS